MSKTIGFIGLGNMGMPMSEQLIKAGHKVRAFDMSPQALSRAKSLGATVATSIADAAEGATVVLTMLPAGEHVRSVYLGPAG